MKSNTLRTITWVTAFSLAMGLLETAVVIYLREIYYPGGFAFPLQPISGQTAVLELCREAATVLMILAVGVLSGRTHTERFAYFLYTFAVWDIFYYIFLFIFVAWPESLLTWDILFLIPLTWVGPVIAPVINALSMILLALIIIRATTRHGNARLNTAEWLLLIPGSVVVVTAYTEEYVRYMMQEFTFTGLLFPDDANALLARATQFVPRHFSWWLFAAGQLSICAGIVSFFKRHK